MGRAFSAYTLQSLIWNTLLKKFFPWDCLFNVLIQNYGGETTVRSALGFVKDLQYLLPKQNCTYNV